MELHPNFSKPQAGHIFFLKTNKNYVVHLVEYFSTMYEFIDSIPSTQTLDGGLQGHSRGGGRRIRCSKSFAAIS